jgi:hypothetical protein
VGTNNQGVQDQLNEAIGPIDDQKLVQHGANDDFVTDHPDGTRSMGRQPGADEIFLLVEPSGNTQIVHGTAALQRYYVKHGFAWPYDDFVER